MLANCGPEGPLRRRRNTLGPGDRSATSLCRQGRTVERFSVDDLTQIQFLVASNVREIKAIVYSPVNISESPFRQSPMQGHLPTFETDSPPAA